MSVGDAGAGRVVILRERGQNGGSAERGVRHEDSREARPVRGRRDLPATPPDWPRRLALPAAHVAADEALALTQKVDEALAHLQDGTEPEALHDFRVAVRRLRAWLRGFEPVLAVRARTSRRLRRLSQRTNRARDAQATLAWLRSAVRDLSPRMQNSVRVLQSELAVSLAGTNKTLAARVEKDWARAARRLRKELMDRAPARGVDESFGSVWAEALEKSLAEATERRRAAVTGSGDETIHRYRMSLKRIRYLLEPAAPALADALRAVKQAKRGQDQAGAINDLQHLLAWLRRRSRELSARRGEAAFELRLEGRDGEAQRVVARAGYRLRPLVVAGRLAVQELAERTAAFEQTESRTREPRYANGVRRVIQTLRAAKPRQTRTPQPKRRERIASAPQ